MIKEAVRIHFTGASLDDVPSRGARATGEWFSVRAACEACEICGGASWRLAGRF
jgi:hypothetical protein